MNFWTPGNLGSVTQGRWLVAPGEAPPPLTGVSIDSRAVKAGELFVALKGERVDGHDYIEQAIANGAAAIMVERDDACDTILTKRRDLSRSESSPCVLHVPDTIAALQAYAAAYREVLGASGVKVVAVTGSNGKTTTRQLIHAVLASTLKGTQSPKSFNNHLGVPLTVLGAAAEDDFVVAEVGTNHPGEIASLAAIIKPDVAVITTISGAHIGNFGGLEAIAREKASLLPFVAPGGCAITPADVAYAEQVQAQIPPGVQSVRFGEADLQPGAPIVTGMPMRFTLASGVAVALPLLGGHNVANALAAVAVGRHLGVTERDAAAALRDMPRPAMRLELTTIGQGADAITVINDAYNANPDSVRAALGVFAELARSGDYPRGIVVLADMLELGDTAPDEHRRVGEALAKLDAFVAQAVLVGKLSMFTAETLARTWAGDRIITVPQWTDDLPQRVAALVQPGDLVLLKGSRGMALERLLPAMSAVTC